MEDGRLVVFDFGSGHRLDKLVHLVRDKRRLIVSFDMTRDTHFCPRDRLVLEYKRQYNLDVYKLEENLFFVHHDVTRISHLPWKADYVITRPLKTDNGVFPFNMLHHLNEDCVIFIRPEIDRVKCPLEYQDYVDEIRAQLAPYGFKFIAKGDSFVAVRGNTVP